MPEPLTHGTDAVLNDRCPWPERRGLLATVQGTDDCGHEYPVSGLGRGEVVVFVSEDPLKPQPSTLPNGLPWSCVVARDCLTLLSDLPPDTDLRAVLRHWETES